VCVHVVGYGWDLGALNPLPVREGLGFVPEKGGMGTGMSLFRKISDLVVNVFWITEQLTVSLQ